MTAHSDTAAMPSRISHTIQGEPAIRRSVVLGIVNTTLFLVEHVEPTSLAYANDPEDMQGIQNSEA